MMETAFDSVRDSYDIDDLRAISEHGCHTGVAHQHIYYRDTVKFFDEYEDEIIEYIADTVGGDYNEEIWNRNPCHIDGYKNDSTWCYVELVASQLVDEYESTTCEELSTSTYDSVKELASTPWGQEHLEIITA